jgi:predicted lipoprotein with Yx(FWY)xxD motif
MNKKNLLLSLVAVSAASFALAEPATVLEARKADPHGTIVADADGKALYLFTKDTQGKQGSDAASACYETCANAWPPLTVHEQARVGQGLQQELVSTIQRTDGTTQVTYGGWPLYYFAKDSGEQINGQGVGDVWYLVAPDGSTIKTSGKTSKQ